MKKEKEGEKERGGEEKKKRENLFVVLKNHQFNYQTAHCLIPYLIPFTLLDVCHWKKIMKGTEKNKTSQQPSRGQLEGA